MSDFRPSDPETSRLAAEGNREHRLIDRARALAALVAVHPAGLTDFELGDLTRRQQTSIGKRRKELQDLGYVEHAGYTRASPSGAKAIVWRATWYGVGQYEKHTSELRTATRAVVVPTADHEQPSLFDGE